MWLFLVTEIMFFGGLFWRLPDLPADALQRLRRRQPAARHPVGAFNTAVLLISSVTVVLAVRAAQDGSRKQLVAYLIVTVLLGLTFLGVKASSTRRSSRSTMFPDQPLHLPTLR